MQVAERRRAKACLPSRQQPDGPQRLELLAKALSEEVAGRLQPNLLVCSEDVGMHWGCQHAVVRECHQPSSGGDMLGGRLSSSPSSWSAAVTGFPGVDRCTGHAQKRPGSCHLKHATHAKRKPRRPAGRGQRQPALKKRLGSHARCRPGGTGRYYCSTCAVESLGKHADDAEVDEEGTQQYQERLQAQVPQHAAQAAGGGRVGAPGPGGGERGWAGCEQAWQVRSAAAAVRAHWCGRRWRAGEPRKRCFSVTGRGAGFHSAIAAPLQPCNAACTALLPLLLACALHALSTSLCAGLPHLLPSQLCPPHCHPASRQLPPTCC